MFQVSVLFPTGEELDPILEYTSLSLTVANNEIGSGTIELPLPRDPTVFRPNTRFMIYRETPQVSRHIFANSVWFLEKVTRSQRENTLRLTIADQHRLLKQRVVAYTGETPYADKTLDEFDLITPDDRLRLDNMMRAYVAENYSTLALDTDRNNSYILVEDDRNLAPYGSKEASFAVLMDVLQDLAKQSEQQGVPLFFRLIPRGDHKFNFQVALNQIGVDRSSTSVSPVILSESAGDLDNVEEEYDFTEMGNYCYVLGEGSGAARHYEEVANEALLRNDPFARREFTIEYVEADEQKSEVMIAKGQAALQGRRPRARIVASVVDGNNYHYGADYDYGYRVAAVVGDEAEGVREFDAYIAAVNVQASGEQEEINIKLESVNFL